MNYVCLLLGAKLAIINLASLSEARSNALDHGIDSPLGCQPSYTCKATRTALRAAAAVEAIEEGGACLVSSGGNFLGIRTSSVSYPFRSSFPIDGSSPPVVAPLDIYFGGDIASMCATYGMNNCTKGCFFCRTDHPGFCKAAGPEKKKFARRTLASQAEDLAEFRKDQRKNPKGL